jgi:hypothetical protein
LERRDAPLSPIYDGRPDRLSTVLGLGWQPLDSLHLGAAVTLTPALDTPTHVTYVAGRGDTPDEEVVVRLDRNLRYAVAPLFGIRSDPWPFLSLGLAYRAPSISRASGDSRTSAGGILADDPIDYFQMWNPAELSAGVAVKPGAELAVSADAVWSRWSEMRDGFNRRLAQPFESTVSFRGGVEWRGVRALALRAGYAFEPTPIPEQVGDTNYLGADTHTISLGGGLDLRELTGAPLKLDAHVRGQLGGRQHSDKQISALSDADPATPGRQIDNLGYPGFDSQSHLLQAGLTLTLFVGKEKKP